VVPTHLARRAWQADPHPSLPEVWQRHTDQAVASQHPLHTRLPFGVATWVEWCGHQVEVIMVPEKDGRFSEIPVLGEAR